LICRDCIKVEKDKYILPEWTNRYQNLSFVKKHKMRKRKSERVHLTLMRKLISEHLNNLEGKVDSAVNIVKLLIPQNSKFTIQAIYKMLRSDNHFYQFTKDRKILVRLVQPNDN